MTREQQKLISAWKKSDAPLIKKYTSLYKLKKRGNSIWQLKDSMFYRLFLCPGNKDEQAHLYSSVTYKPLWLDDLFWEIMDMASNSNEPPSLRAVGAFALHGVDYRNEYLLPVQPCPEEMERLVMEEIKAFVNVTVSVEDYMRNAESAVYHGGIMRILNTIYSRDYKKAKKLLSEEKADYFVNNNEDFGTRAWKYIEMLES